MCRVQADTPRKINKQEKKKSLCEVQHERTSLRYVWGRNINRNLPNESFRSAPLAPQPPSIGDYYLTFVLLLPRYWPICREYLKTLYREDSILDGANCCKDPAPAASSVCMRILLITKRFLFIVTHLAAHLNRLLGRRHDLHVHERYSADFPTIPDKETRTSDARTTSKYIWT